MAEVVLTAEATLSTRFRLPAVSHARAVARSWSVISDSTMVACRSASKSVQSNATTMAIRVPVT